MKKNFYRNLAYMLIFTGGLCMSTNAEAQVTVGSKGVPNQGALLDMKQEDKADGSANSKKGLGLPRVALTAVDKLDPCVATTGIAATDDAAKKSHIGLTVYNTTDNTSTDSTLSEGVYAWDGAMWTQYSGTTAGGAENGLSMDGKKVVLGGPLNRPTTITGDATNNLSLNTPTKVGSTLGVTGATTLGSTLGVAGVTSLKTTNISGATTITNTGSLTLAGNGAGAGKVLTSDVNGKGTWQTPTYESTNATNGLSMSGTDVQLGGALTKNTLITGTNTLGLNVPTTVGNTLAVTGAATLGSTLAVTGATTTKATNVTGVMKYTNTTPVVGQYLSAINTDGTVAWTTLPALPSTATNTEPWRVQGGLVEATQPTDATFVTGNVAIGSNTSGTNKLQVTGNTNIIGNSVVSGNSKTATSTVTGNETVGGTLVVTNATTLNGNLASNGVTTTKATNVTGVMKYTNTTPVVGQYLSATNADGTVAWTTLPALPSTATNTEPWRVQGGLAEATQPTDATFVTGNVAIGSNTSGTNKLQVTGNTNIIGNSVVSGDSKTATSTVIGNETVGGTLGVTGATTLTGNLTSNGITALKNTNINGNLAVTGTTTLGSNIAAPVGAALNIQTQADADPTNGGVTSNKGFMLPRVALTGVNSLDPIITGTPTDLVKKSYKGLQVYNVSSAVEGAGVRTWDGEKWLKIVTTIPPAEVTTSNIHNLIGNYSLKNVSDNTRKPMSFGTKQSDGTYAIDIQQDGSYTFALRLYGRSLNLNYYTGNLNFYIYLYSDGVLVDALEYPMTISAYQPYGSSPISSTNYPVYIGLSTNMSAKNIKKGAKITIDIKYGTFYYYIGGTGLITAQDEKTKPINWIWNGVANDNAITAVRSSLVYYKL